MISIALEERCYVLLDLMKWSSDSEASRRVAKNYVLHPLVVAHFLLKTWTPVGWVCAVWLRVSVVCVGCLDVIDLGIVVSVADVSTPWSISFSARTGLVN